MAKKEDFAEAENEGGAIDDDSIVDYITQRLVKDSPKERVRQHVARALFHEDGLSPEDMEPDFPLPGETEARKRRKRADIALFEHDRSHAAENIVRVAVVRPEPKASGRGSVTTRTLEQAEKDLDELKELMTAVSSCRYGLWTNGVERFYLQKEQTRFETSFQPLSIWPAAGETLGSRTVASEARLRPADKEMLRRAFRRCHNFIHGNEGMPKDAAFWQFLYLIFCKIHDERKSLRGAHRF